MASHHRHPRPAATDYFNPTEQIELLQSIKAKAEKSATSTPQDPQVAHSDDTIGMTGQQAAYPGAKSVDFRAHELSLREKLEKAKADREARAKAAEAALRASSQPPSTTNESTQGSRLVELKSSESVPPGPPPPPGTNNTTPTPISTAPYGQAWTANLTYMQGLPMANFGTAAFPYPQTFTPQYGSMQPFGNGQPAQVYSQWSQFSPQQNTPGVPPPPAHPNQGPPSQAPPNQGPQTQVSPSQGPSTLASQNQVPKRQSPPTPVNLTQVPPNQTAPTSQGLQCLKEY